MVTNLNIGIFLPHKDLVAATAKYYNSCVTAEHGISTKGYDSILVQLHWFSINTSQDHGQAVVHNVLFTLFSADRGDVDN